MGTCKDCEFWGRYRQSVCDAIEMDEPGHGFVHIEARMSDDSGLSVDLVTTPDFGCTLFQRKGE